MIYEDATLEVARVVRHAATQVAAKIAARQLGEDFAGLDDRRRVETIARGKDRRDGLPPE